MSERPKRDLTHDFILPTLLFVVLGAMTWAVRGCSGFGAMPGCLFAGVTWGAAWWFIARDPHREQSRRYSSGWIILALTVGIGLSGARGWMQWPSFFDGRLQTDTAAGKFVPISRSYGFLWLFIAGVPWAGIGACMLAWCGSLSTTKWWHWILRIAFGFAAAFVARYAFDRLPQVFLPLYGSMEDQYRDLKANPNLRRLINDSRLAIWHLGFYLGFLLFEIWRKDWKNVTLISTVGFLNGLGWSLCQNWKWAPGVWPNGHFNWWRCWESSGGISIGFAYGVAYFLVNRPTANSDPGDAIAVARLSATWHPNLERFGACLGLIYGLGMSLKNGLKGWANIYIGNEVYWNQKLWSVIGPTMLALAIVSAIWIALRPIARDFTGDIFPHASGMIWLVLIQQNAIAQLVTGPLSSWNEMAFSIYYLLLFLISAVIVCHYQFVKQKF